MVTIVSTAALQRRANPLFYPVNARVIDFTLTLSALLRRKTQTQSSAWLWWMTADFSRALSGQFSAPENSRKICVQAPFPPLCIENLMFAATPRTFFSIIAEIDSATCLRWASLLTLTV